jgi:hypothetical protein
MNNPFTNSGSDNDELHRTQMWRQRALFKMYLSYVNHADVRPAWHDFLDFEREMADAPLQEDSQEEPVNALG